MWSIILFHIFIYSAWMCEEVDIPQGQISEGEGEGEGSPEEWGRGQWEAACMEVHGGDGLPSAIPPK